MKTFLKTCLHILFLGGLFYILLKQPDELNTTVFSWFDSDISCYKLIGYAGILYLLYFSYILFFRPVYRDWWLANKNYITAIAYLVAFMPFIFFNLFNNREIDSNDLVEDSSNICCMQPINPDTPKTLWGIYYHMVDPGNQHMANSKGKPWAGILAVLGIILFNGLMVSAIVGYVDLRRDKIQNGKIWYRFFNISNFIRFKKHYIIIGGNDIVSGIVEQLLNEDSKKKKSCFKKILSQVYGKPYILIQTSCDVESFRKELFSTLTEEEQRRIIVYYGNRTSKEDISKLRINRAKEVYIIGEDTRNDDNESYHDTMNMKCLRLINDEIKNSQTFKKGKELVCRVMFEYQTSFNVLQVTDINVEKIKFLPFNYYEMWAQNVLICKEFEKEENCEYLPLEGFHGIKSDDDGFVHLVIVGMSRMGVAMSVEAAHLCHFPNYETNKIRTRITFIDKNATEEKDFFMGRFKELFALSHWRYGAVENNSLKWEQCHQPVGCDHLGGDFLDIEWEFINGSVENPAIQKYLADASRNKDAKLTIAICLPENSRAIAAAAYLPNCIYEETSSTQQVLVYQRLNDELVNQINNNGRYSKKLKAFGMTKKCYNLSLTEMAESISKEVVNAYEQYAWEQMKKRYIKLTDDDYDKISNGFYGISSDNKKEIIKNGCDEWIKENRGKINYSEVKSSFEYPRADINKTNDKPKSAKMWSNQYNIYSMFSKFRCFGTDPSKGFKGSMMKEVGEVEHNRWVLEQLLLRYRPLTCDEQMKAKITDLYSPTADKNKYKKAFAHLDICSNSKLKEIDYNVAELDEALTKVLPTAYTSYLKTVKHND